MSAPEFEKALGAYEFKPGSGDGLKLNERFRWSDEDLLLLGKDLKCIERELGVRFFVIQKGLDVVTAETNAADVAAKISEGFSKANVVVNVTVAGGSVTA